jgi:hypothetical protein
MKIHIGQNPLSRKSISIPIEALMETHTIVPGRTGMGKSCLFEIMSRTIIESGNALIFLDGKGDTFHGLQKFVAVQGLGSKTVLIDPTDTTHSVGINYMELFGNTSPDALAELVLEGLMKFFKEDDEYKPWLEEWGPVSILPLIQEGFTLLELFKFTSLEDTSFRNAVLSKLGIRFYQEKWREFLQTFKPTEQARMLNVVRTRATKFWTSGPLKYIFGQKKTTFDWLKLMNEGGILLANLGRTPNLAEKTGTLIGTALVHQLLLNAPLRPKGQRRPVFFIVDEFDRFVCNDFADALSRLRGFGIYLILSCQYLSQLSKENERVYDAVMANCNNRFVFSLSAQDAEKMEDELFAGYRHDPQVKDEVWQTKLRPKETTRMVNSKGTARAIGSFSGRGSGISDSLLSTSTSMISLSERGDVLVSGSASGSTEGHGRVSSEILTDGSSEIFTQTETEARVPWYEYEEYQELTSRSYYTLEEIKERYRAWIVKQDPRHLQMKIGSKKPIPVITADLEEVRVLPSWLKHFRQKVFEKTAPPVSDLEKEIEGRVKDFLGSSEVGQKISQYPESFRVPKKSKKLKQ